MSIDDQVAAYVAKSQTPILNFSKVKYHKIYDFWKPIKPKYQCITIKKNKFYILKSKEKIQIPNNMAGEMIPLRYRPW